MAGEKKDARGICPACEGVMMSKEGKTACSYCGFTPRQRPLLQEPSSVM
ncbi:MAG TPA: hypothetical protein VJI67_02690 [archaeon]|nr:hypothetical protein [archaeon]HLD81250.1 hypothetical protein [archaeon]